MPAGRTDCRLHERSIASQAEIAGGVVATPDELPIPGRRLRDFALISTGGRQVCLSDYRGRSNLVLVFADEQPAAMALLSNLAERYEEFRTGETEIIAVAQLTSDESARLSERLKFPYPVLLDADGRVHREVGAGDSQGNTAAAVYISDRYGEVFGAYRTRDGQALPGADEMLNWLQFINSQCPECEPPEWPVS